ncbi:MAG: hypothetical protein WCL51_17915 [Bacteroidota bacterium]
MTFKNVNLFKIAEIAKFNPDERMDYEESVKIYRDLKNSIDTAREEGIGVGKVQIAKEMILENEPIDKIIKYTKLTKSQIDDIIKELRSNK